MHHSFAQQTNPTEPLASQLWLSDFLATKGFARISPETFSNGKSTLRFDGATLIAHPGSGDRSWTVDFTNARRDTVKLLIEQFLAMRIFQSEKQLADEQVERQRLNLALTGIAETINEGPDTGSGLLLRRFLWSLYNGHHLVNLWRMTCVLDSRRSSWITEVFVFAFSGLLKENDIKRTLQACGEMERCHEVHLSGYQIDLLREAERSIESVLRTLPPSQSHSELKQARDYLCEAQKSIQRVRVDPTIKF